MRHLSYLVIACLVSAAVCIEESPMARVICAMCNSGSGLVTKFLPEGTTCLDLDTAMQNIGKPGCFGLKDVGTDKGIDFNDPEKARAAYEKLEAEYFSVMRQVSRLEIALAIVVISSVIIIAILVFTVYR
jgi:hypothetical protein